MFRPTFQRISQRAFSILFGIGLGLAMVSCGTRSTARVPVSGTPPGGLSVSQVRHLLQHLGGANWSSQQIELKSINSGIGGDNAVVEAQIETAFRLAKQNGDWRVAEIRLGDRQWESLDLIEIAVRHEKERRTAGLLQRLADGLQAYQREKGQFPATDEIAALLDYLSPRYIGDPIRFDWWGTQFNYRGTATTYRLTSAGNDRKNGTNDDLILENGVLRAQNNE